MKGVYRAVLISPGGDLAFPLHIQYGENDSLKAFLINGADTVRFDDISLKKDSLIIGFDFYDSYLRGKINDYGNLAGKWNRRAEGGERSQLPFFAEKGVSERYPTAVVKEDPFNGEWEATFSDEEGTWPAHAIFVSESDGNLHGTFLTETGDYRFLEGFYTDSTFTLSTFDGAHAFLFKGQIQSDGSLKGDFWSRDTYHATWKAQKGEGNNSLRDPLQISAEEAVGNPMKFSFPDLQGDTVSVSNARFKNKPMLVYLFGSWCPNCADETRMIRSIYEETYKDTDLQVVGLAFEFTGNYAKDAKMVKKYQNRFNIPWVLLVAGTSDKKKAAQTLPFLNNVVSYPTSIFVNRNHIINAIHVGFNGPATGSVYYKELQRFKENIDEIIEP